MPQHIPLPCCFLSVLLFASAASGADAGLVNPSFEAALEAQGRVTGWEGNPAQFSLVDMAHGGRRGKALAIAKGGSVSQTVPATAGRHYTLTVLAHTPLIPEAEGDRFRSPGRLELTFIPSDTKLRTDMISPFGDSREFVDYSIGGQAPEGTQQVRVAVIGLAGDLKVDDVRLVAYEDSYTHFAPKKLCMDTAIVADAQPRAKIVLPKSGAYDALGQRIAGRIRQLTAVDVPIVRDSAFDLCRDQRLDENLIVLGNRSTNRVISDLYDLYYCILDLRYPGKGGSVVRSLHDPFGDGRNVLLVGASDEAGMKKAVESFLAALDETPKAGKSLTVAYLARIELGSDVNIPKEMSFIELQQLKPWDATAGTGGYGWTVITKCMALSYLSGHEFYAREFMRLAFPKDAQTLKDLESCGQDFWGDHQEPLVDAYHYRSHLPVVSWDLIEESPFFSDADRARLTLQFMKQVKAFRSNKDYGCAVDKTTSPTSYLGDRHSQWGAMTFWTLGRYLGKHYPDYEWKAVKRAAEHFLAPLHTKKHVYNMAERDKLERHPTTLAAPFAYTLMSGNKAPLKVGSLQEQTRARMEIPLDGREDAWVLWQAPTSLFNHMAYLFGNSRYLGIRDLIYVPSADGSASSPPRDAVFRPGQSYWPDERALPLDPLPTRQWEILRPTREERSFWAVVWQTPFEQVDKSFLVSSFRTSDDGRGDFLLFEGMHTGGVHKCFALTEHILSGNILFMGARTQLNTLSDGMTSAKQPTYSLLERTEANGESSLVQARVPGYPPAGEARPYGGNAMDWERTLLHRQGRYTLFVDTLTGQQTSASSTVEFNWSLAHNARATAVSPGCAVIKVDGGWSQKPLYEFNALTCPSAQFKLGSPETAIQRSDYNAIVLRDQQKGDYLDITFQTERDVEGYMVAEAVGSPRCGLFRMELDGVVLAQEINGYAPRTGRAVIAVNLGRQKLRAGSHVLRLVSLGPSPESEGHRISFRGFKMLGQFGSTDYVLGLSSKLAVEKGGMGTVIGSTESGDTLTAVWTGPLTKGQQARFFALVAPKTGNADAVGNCLPLAPNASALALEAGKHVVTGAVPRASLLEQNRTRLAATLSSPSRSPRASGVGSSSPPI